VKQGADDARLIDATLISYLAGDRLGLARYAGECGERITRSFPRVIYSLH